MLVSCLCINAKTSEKYCSQILEGAIAITWWFAMVCMMSLALNNLFSMVFNDDIPTFVGATAFATTSVTLSMTKSVDLAFLAHSQSAMEALGNF